MDKGTLQAPRVSVGHRAAFALPDGRAVPQVAVGRFGAAVVRQAPGYSAIRSFGDKGEVDVYGEWMPLELPMRKVRLDSGADGARLSSGDREFVVNVYAAVVTAPHEVDRAPWASILAPEQILPYLAALPSASSRS